MQSCFHGLLPTLHALWEELGYSGEGQLEAQPCGRCWGETTVGRIRAWRWLRVSPDSGWGAGSLGCPPALEGVAILAPPRRPLFSGLAGHSLQGSLTLSVPSLPQVPSPALPAAKFRTLQGLAWDLAHNRCPVNSTAGGFTGPDQIQSLCPSASCQDTLCLRVPIPPPCIVKYCSVLISAPVPPSESSPGPPRGLTSC